LLSPAGFERSKLEPNVGLMGGMKVPMRRNFNRKIFSWDYLEGGEEARCCMMQGE
jgi:hypothetical protein